MKNKRAGDIKIFFYQIIDLRYGLAINFCTYNSEKKFNEVVSK